MSYTVLHYSFTTWVKSLDWKLLESLKLAMQLMSFESQPWLDGAGDPGQQGKKTNQSLNDDEG